MARPTLRQELLESFRLYADPKFTGHDPARPIAQIIFGAPGDVVSPPSFEFMGFGRGAQGEAFSESGGFDLSGLLRKKADRAEDLSESKAFSKACVKVTAALKSVAKSPERKRLPANGPIIFALSLDGQGGRILGRIHPDGRWEDPPNKKQEK